MSKRPRDGERGGARGQRLAPFDPDLFRLDAEVAGRARAEVHAMYGDTLFHVHVFDVRSARARDEFARAVKAKAAEVLRVAVPAARVEHALMKLAGGLDGAAAVAVAADYRLVEDPDDPDASGLFRVTGEAAVRLTNAALRLTEVTAVADEVQDTVRYTLRGFLGGRAATVSLTPDEFASGEKLKAAVYKVCGPKAEFLHGGVEEVRRAVSRVSQPVEQRVTTAHGWDASYTQYLTLNGSVDRDGFHPYPDDAPIRVDLGGEEAAQGLGLMRLSRDRLREVKEHLVHDFLALNDPRVTRTAFAAPALAVLMRSAGRPQRAALWWKGVTGGGKSFVMKLAANAFGDMPLDDGRLFTTWASTANRVEKAGYFFRDAIFPVDDYKPEVVPPALAVRVLQAYADGTARGRLRADASTARVWPIRGLLCSTGEDLVQGSASSIARMVVIKVPNRPKDRARAARCESFRPLYRGVTAAFLAYLIRNGRVARFPEVVASYFDVFYEGIAGRQNDARIAGNFALLAGAFYETARFYRDVIPGWEDLVDAYVHEDLIAIRDEMLGLLHRQQPSEVFLDELRDLVALGAVRLVGWPTGSGGGFDGPHGQDRASVVGRYRQGEDAVEVAVKAALAEVQGALRAKGRPELAVSEPALLDQLHGDGLLLGRDGRPLGREHAGQKTYQARVFDDGGRANVVRLGAETVLGDAHVRLAASRRRDEPDEDVVEE
jgi:hypothetical protein